MVRPIMQRRGVKVCAIWPNQRVHLGVNADLIEQPHVSERGIQFTGQDRLKVDGLNRSVVELNPQRIRHQDFEADYAMDGMAHRIILAAQSGVGFFLAVVFPNRPAVRSDIIRPKLRPGVVAVSARNRHNFHRVDAEDPHLVMKVGVKAHDMMLRANLSEHANNDAEEST
jgi:hypothetical protein